jgi:hypothetical protein
VRVGVKGHTYGSVPQQLLHHLGVYAAPEQGRGAGVPEVVETDLREPGLLEEWLEGAIHKVLRVDERTNIGDEDQAAIFVDTGG